MQLSKTIRWARFSECTTEGKISSVGNWCSISGKGLAVNNFLSITERATLFLQLTLQMNQQAISQWYLSKTCNIHWGHLYREESLSRIVQSGNALIYGDMSFVSLCMDFSGSRITHFVLSDLICSARWYMNIATWLISSYKMIKPRIFHITCWGINVIPLGNCSYQPPQFSVK